MRSPFLSPHPPLPDTIQPACFHSIYQGRFRYHCSSLSLLLLSCSCKTSRSRHTSLGTIIIRGRACTPHPEYGSSILRSRPCRRNARLLQGVQRLLQRSWSIFWGWLTFLGLGGVWELLRLCGRAAIGSPPLKRMDRKIFQVFLLRYFSFRSWLKGKSL